MDIEPSRPDRESARADSPAAAAAAAGASPTPAPAPGLTPAPPPSPATRTARWRRTLGFAIRAPILAIVYMMFLPLVGFAVLVWAIARRVDEYLHADAPAR
ncbi:MAG: hypothetical protein HZA54_20645 [Planctomycetes bacterium]|nr:hypothetical protein [Planctomycetota bacterium]